MIHPNTAYKVWISDILNPDNRKSGNIKVGDKDVFRVNLVGSVIMKNVADDGSFASIALDDSSGQILLRCWGSGIELLNGVGKGEVVQVVGRLAEYNGLIYLRPEIVRGVFSDDEVLHRAILLKRWGVPSIAKDDWNGKPVVTNGLQQDSVSVGSLRVVEEKVEDGSDDVVKGKSSPSPRRAILSVIERLDGPEGAVIEAVIKESGLSSDEVQDILDDLLKNGEVFMLRPGRVKVL